MMRIRVRGKEAKIEVRRVRRKHVVNPDVWTKFVQNHDNITREEWEVLRERKRREREERLAKRTGRR